MQELIIPRSSISDLDASPALQAVPTPRVIRNHQAIPSRDDMSLEETRLFCPEPAQSGINRSSQHIPLSLRRQQARLHSPPRPNPFRQTPFDSPARRQSPSYYRESLRQDGKVVIDLDSDSDDEMFVPRTNFGHVGRPLHQRPSPTFTTGTPAHQIPDRRARCETVDDEEDPFQRSSTTSAPVRTKEVGSRRKTRGPFLADSEDESDVTIQ